MQDVEYTPREASSEEKAIIVKQWRNSQAIVLGDETKQEWIVAPNCYSLEMMR